MLKINITKTKLKKYNCAFTNIKQKKAKLRRKYTRIISKQNLNITAK